MTEVFHAGELAVQTRAGGRQTAQRVGQGINSTIAPAVRHFLHAQPMAVLSSVDTRGRVWASLLAGEPGFMHVANDRTLQIKAAPLADDPLHDALHVGAAVGLVVIDLATRRRIRVNGLVSARTTASISVHTEQVYGNCPKYIQTRQWEIVHPSRRPVYTAHSGPALDAAQQRWITHADTFFFGSFHPQSGADASHRGGHPGFVRVVHDRQLVWPDYSGNNMFQTLGNVYLYPNSGLLFIDFAHGDTLQLTGRAAVSWDTDRITQVVGAERLVEFHIDQVVHITSATALRWRLMEYSPFNPA